ncbi:MAG: DUF420 domain-containing protein [Halobacteriales archaeon]|nr:DUF420 domain-containing protein [Halobacteriales archaeon]
MSVKQVPDNVKEISKEHNVAVTVVLSVVGYAAVVATFADVLPYPELSTGTVNILTHLIALVNAATLVCILTGWYWIRNGEIDKHRKAMLSAFSLIILFLLIYLFRVGGGETKVFVGPEFVRNYVYLPMLGVHLLLSIVAVPVVVYAAVLGLTHTPRELREETLHKKVGRIAAGSWAFSLFLGIVTYVMLNHMYSWTT